MKKFFSRSEGFTLIELMIVILIIAILVAIAVPVFLSQQSKARQRTCQANQRTVDSAVLAYQAAREDGSYPTQLSDMLSGADKTLKTTPSCPIGPTAYSWIASTPPYISCPTTANHTI